MKARHNQGESKAEARQKQERSKAKARQKQDGREIEGQLLRRMKWLPFNKIIIYLCENLKDEYDPVTSRSVCKDLHLNYSRVYGILTDLEYLGFLKLEIRGAGLNSWTGVFNQKTLKLKKFEKLAKNRVGNLNETKQNEKNAKS
jgi:hypothetical protein